MSIAELTPATNGHIDASELEMAFIDTGTPPLISKKMMCRNEGSFGELLRGRPAHSVTLVVKIHQKCRTDARSGSRNGGIEVIVGVSSYQARQ
jgi:hypothetical protein